MYRNLPSSPGVHNVLVHSGLLPGLKVWDQERGPVANMQARTAKIDNGDTTGYEEKNHFWFIDETVIIIMRYLYIYTYRNLIFIYLILYLYFDLINYN